MLRLARSATLCCTLEMFIFLNKFFCTCMCVRVLRFSFRRQEVVQKIFVQVRLLAQNVPVNFTPWTMVYIVEEFTAYSVEYMVLTVPSHLLTVIFSPGYVEPYTY